MHGVLVGYAATVVGQRLGVEDRGRAGVGRAAAAARRITARRGFRGFLLTVLGVLVVGRRPRYAFERAAT
ncbi:MAG: hypothetical protein ACR2KP_01470 [Egibacteraceae bacterium]